MKEEMDMDEEKRDIGTAPLVLGIISVVLSLTLSRVVGFILGILAIVKGGRYRHVDNDARAGWILGIIGVTISGLFVFLLLLLILLLFVPMVLPFFWF